MVLAAVRKRSGWRWTENELKVERIEPIVETVENSVSVRIAGSKAWRSLRAGDKLKINSCKRVIETVERGVSVAVAANKYEDRALLGVFPSDVARFFVFYFRSHSLGQLTLGSGR